MSTQEVSEPSFSKVSGSDEPQRSSDFANKLADYYFAEKGYERSVPPEAASLLETADIVLSGHNGYALSIVCIVDAEADPTKIFSFSVDHTRDIAQSLFKYTQTSSGATHYPVTISVIEIRKNPIYERSHQLDGFRKKGLFDKRILQSCVVCPSSRLHISTSKQLDDFVVSVLDRPTLTVSDIQNYQRAVEIPTGQPILTYALLGGMALIFGCEILLNLDGMPSDATPSVQTLVALGGNMGSLTLGQNQWYRLWTAIVLHAGPSHIILNAVALFIAGRILEPLLGSLRFFAIFMLGGICGSLASAFWNPQNLVGVGASGAIMACFGAAIVISFHYPAGRFQSRLIKSSISILIPSLLPFMGSHSGHTVDYADHIGGAIGGVIMGGYFLVIWPRTQVRPSDRYVPLVAMLIGTAGLIVGSVLTMISYSEQVQIAKAIKTLAPQNEVASLWKNAVSGGDTMVSRYPLDPRGHLGRAIHLLDAGKPGDAEAEVDLALNQRFTIEKALAPDVRLNALAVLALAQNHQGRQTEAHATASPLCKKKTSIIPFLVKEGLCPAST